VSLVLFCVREVHLEISVRRLAILTFLMIFLSPCRQMPEYCSILDHGLTFFAIHYSLIVITLYSLNCSAFRPVTINPSCDISPGNLLVKCPFVISGFLSTCSWLYKDWFVRRHVIHTGHGFGLGLCVECQKWEMWQEVAGSGCRLHCGRRVTRYTWGPVILIHTLQSSCQSLDSTKFTGHIR
jgi:hypothetical protein